MNEFARPGMRPSVGPAHPKDQKCWREWCDSPEKIGSHPQNTGDCMPDGNNNAHYNFRLLSKANSQEWDSTGHEC